MSNRPNTPKPDPTSAPVPSPAPSPVPPPPGPAPHDVTQLLLDVLRNVNREVKTSLELTDKAKTAVEHFQAISLSLRTLADTQ